MLPILICAASLGTFHSPHPAFWDWSPKPALGWNSYDAFGDTVTEAQVLDNARYIKDHLKRAGYNLAVVDFRWYDPNSTGIDADMNSKRVGAKLAMDAYGRLQPAENRFPSSGHGIGFKALAENIHRMGLRFGIHLMRGIPRNAVASNLPIKGSMFTASDAGDPTDKCGWCPDMFGVRSNAAGQAWYDSIFKQYAEWGIDFVKVDDLSQPFHTSEIEMIRKAIDGCGRRIILSTSPGPTPLSQSESVSRYANQWRISGDFWDNWGSLKNHFDLFAAWAKTGNCGPGHFPDGDMIPFGRLAIKSANGGSDHRSFFTVPERLTLLSLWSLGSSPLILGGNLPDLDPETFSEITNKAMLSIDQDPLGIPAIRIKNQGDTEVWVKKLSGSHRYAVGIFNTGDLLATIQFRWAELGVKSNPNLEPVWQRQVFEKTPKGLKLVVAPHGVQLFLLKS